GGDDAGGEQPARDGAERVAGDQPRAAGGGEEQPTREAVLEVARDAEAGEDAAEGGRLEQDEAELEAGVAGRVVEARHVAQTRETACERDEVEQREREPGKEQRRVVQDVVDRPPADRERRRTEVVPHVRVILWRRATAEAPSAVAIKTAEMANASPTASPFQPSITRLRIPSIRYETGFTVASQRNQSASIRFRGKFIEETSRNMNRRGKRPCTASPDPVRSAMNRPTAPKPKAIATARTRMTATPAGPLCGWTPTT